MNGNTTVQGAAFGAAVAAILVYLIEVLANTDIPSAIEGSVLVVVTGLVAYLIPPNSGEPR